MPNDLLHGHLDLLLLAVLDDGPRHGYGLIRELASRSGNAFVVPEGSAYPALQRLERRGLVMSEWSDQGRRRRTYALTADGRRELSRSTQEWRVFRRHLDAVVGVTA